MQRYTSAKNPPATCNAAGVGNGAAETSEPPRQFPTPPVVELFPHATVLTVAGPICPPLRERTLILRADKILARDSLAEISAAVLVQIKGLA